MKPVTNRRRDPALVVRRLLIIFAGFLATGAVAVLQLLDSPVCVNAPSVFLEYAQSTAAQDYAPTWSSELSPRIPGVDGDVEQSLDTVRLCRSDPSGGLQLLSILRFIPGLLFAFGFVLIAGHLLAVWTRAGGLTEVLGRRVEVLGWYLGAGAVVESVARAWATAATIDGMVPGTMSVGAVLSSWSVSICLLLTAAATVSLARAMMRFAVRHPATR